MRFFGGVGGFDARHGGFDARGVGGGEDDVGAVFDACFCDGEADARGAADDEDTGGSEFGGVFCLVGHLGVDVRLYPWGEGGL